MLSTSFESTSLSAQEKKCKINFKDSGHDGHLLFKTGKILATFYSQVTLRLPTKFPVNKPFSSEDVKN